MRAAAGMAAGRAARRRWAEHRAEVVAAAPAHRALLHTAARPQHSPTPPLLTSTLAVFVTETLQPPNVSHKTCSRQAERWKSVSPCAAVYAGAELAAVGARLDDERDRFVRAWWGGAG